VKDRSPLVSIVVPVRDTQEHFLDEALDSLRGQTHRRLDIIVVPYGQAAKATAVVREHALQDYRVRVESPVSSQGAARNRGARVAHGKYLAFAGGADVVPPSAVDAMVACLEGSGSDFVVGDLYEALAPEAARGSGREGAHRQRLRRVDISSFPVAVTDAFVENRLFRTDFWRNARLRFSESDEGLAQTPVIEAYLKATGFDVLDEITYRAMKRGEGLPFGHVHNPMESLDDWLAGQRQIQAVLERSGAEAATREWLRGVLDAGAIPFIDTIEVAGDSQWEAFRDHLRSLAELASDDVWPRVGVESRVKVWLTVQDKRSELQDFVASRWFEQGNKPTEVLDGVVYARLPFHRDPRVDIPDSWFAMSADETPLVASLRGARWSDPETVELDLFAFIEFVGFGGQVPEIHAELVGTSGERVPLEIRQRVDPVVTRASGHRYQNYDHGAFSVRVDTAELSSRGEATPDNDGRSWWIELRVSAHGVTRVGTISQRDLRSSAGAIGTDAFAPRRVGSCLVGLVTDKARGVRFVSEKLPPLELETVRVSGRVVEGRLRPSGTRIRAIRASALKQQAEASVEQGAEGCRFTLELPRLGPLPSGVRGANWRLRAVGVDGTEHVIGWPPETAEPWLGDGTTSEVAVHRSPNGHCEVREISKTVVADDILLEEGAIRVRGRWLGVPPERPVLALQGNRGDVRAPAVSSPDGTLEAVLPTRWDEWGLGESVLPVGVWRLSLVDDADGGGAEESPSVLLSQQLLERPAEEPVNGDFRMRVVRVGRAVAVELTAPLSDEEKGPYRQKRLQQWYASAEHKVDPRVVYFQSYNGGTATDSQLAIHHELRKQRPELVLYWGVSDRSTSLPEGAVPVLTHSREWYRVLATARYLVNNIDFDRWFVKRPDQLFLQTFHGYPAKSMGIRLWAAKQYTPRRIEAELDRTSRQWDLILTPAPEMDRYYRSEYRYDGNIHSRGYPRNDVLVSPEAGEVRRRTREMLGVEPHQKVVLYAPTWRDDLATSWRSAPLVQHLDLETASEALGGEYVFLMRGHRFNARAVQRSSRMARLLDVTNYPEVNDLILASDAAVLDYSSLRFDFALTGRPMLFLVPDLESYTGGVRGFLYDYKDTAPGPLLDDADEVVEHLRNLKALESDYAEARRRFNERYNYLQDGYAAKRVVAEFFGDV